MECECVLSCLLQAQAQAQAQQAAEEACHLDAAAQQLQAEAHLVALKGSLTAQQREAALPYASASTPVDYMQAARETGEQLPYRAEDQQMGEVQVTIACSGSCCPSPNSLTRTMDDMRVSAWSLIIALLVVQIDRTLLASHIQRECVALHLLTGSQGAIHVQDISSGDPEQANFIGRPSSYAAQQDLRHDFSSAARQMQGGSSRDLQRHPSMMHDSEPHTLELLPGPVLQPGQQAASQARQQMSQDVGLQSPIPPFPISCSLPRTGDDTPYIITSSGRVLT